MTVNEFMYLFQKADDSLLNIIIIPTIVTDDMHDYIIKKVKRSTHI